MDSRSLLLTAQPSFMEGLARIFDFGDTLTEYNSSIGGSQADDLATRSDWREVGGDIQAAIDKYGEDNRDLTTSGPKR